MIANSFDHGGRARVTHGETLSRHTVKESLTAGRPIKRNVSDENIFFRREYGFPRRINNQATAGQSLAHVVVSSTSQRKRDALAQKSTEPLPCRASKLKANGIVRQPSRPAPPRD